MHDPRYLEGIRLFNAREWFEAHEVWEDLWRDDPSPGRTFWQGLIMASVALEHWRRGNPRGACSQWTQARERLVTYAPRRHGLDVAEFIAAMDHMMAPIMTKKPVEWRGADRVPRLEEPAAPQIALR